jgi:glyoxylate reductase
MAEGLAECENAVLVPHIGSATIDTRVAMGTLAASNILARCVCRMRSSLL